PSRELVGLARVTPPQEPVAEPAMWDPTYTLLHGAQRLSRASARSAELHEERVRRREAADRARDVEAKGRAPTVADNVDEQRPAAGQGAERVRERRDQ